ncbi:hypothetical protein WEI85_44735 [Actinomycetes bacterium KLBMP 9797]
MTPAATNAVLRRVRAWTCLARALDPDLVTRLRDGRATAALLAGTRAEAAVRLPHAGAAADLFVLLDQLALYGGRQLFVTPLGDWTYQLTDAAPVAGAAPGVTDQVAAGPRMGYRPWPGRIDRVAIITHDRPETLAGCLAAIRDNLHRFGRGHVDVVVYDDSGPARRSRVRSIVDGTAAGRRIRYVGPEEKRAMRAAFERDLPTGWTDRPVLDRLLGAWRANGTWSGSAAEQRNWAILSAAGRRVLVCDDDVRPAALDASLADQRAAAGGAVRDAPPGGRLTAGRLLTGHLAGATLQPWPTDLLGILEETEPTLVSAAYTGHPDRRSALLLERFFVASERSVDVCDTGPPRRHVRQAALAGGPRKFRGGAFVTSGTADGVEFAVRRGRNEDFALGLSLVVTTRGRLRPRESGTAFLLHERGPRHGGPFVAHREEREGDLVHRLIEELWQGYAETAPGPLDPDGFRRYGIPRIAERLPSAADRLAGDLFRDGLAYRARAVAHLRHLSTVEARTGARTRWYADHGTPPAALLRTAARLLRDRRHLPAPVLAACVQVLVPEGIMAYLDVRSMRRHLRTLSGAERAAAIATLEREARWSAQAARPPVAATSADLAARVAAKVARTHRLIAEIDAELAIGPAPARAAPGGDQRCAARARFADEVRTRVGEEVRLFLRALPYAYRLRSVLPVLDGADR